jgi:hypothetical protein
MPESSPFEELLSRWDLNELPSFQRIIDSMDPIAWTLVLLLMGAVVLGVVFTINTRHTFLKSDEVETTPEVLLARLKQGSNAGTAALRRSDFRQGVAL